MRDWFDKLNLDEWGRKISSTLSETAESVGKKTEEVMSVQKLKSQIRTLERGNERDFMDLGKMLFEKYKNGDEISGEFVAICEEVGKRNHVIAAYEKKLSHIKGEGMCKNCQATLPKGAAYCPVCGEKVEKEPIDVEDVEVEDVEAEFEDDFEESDFQNDANAREEKEEEGQEEAKTHCEEKEEAKPEETGE